MLRLHQYKYHRPRSLEQALTLKGEHGVGAMFVAGGTDLMPNMKHQLFTPNHVIALKGIAELHGIRIDGNDLVIGAAETLTDVSRNSLVREHFASLAQAAGLVAGPQLRNMGTIGGNVCLDTRCTYYNQSFFWRDALGYCLKKDGQVCHVTKVGKKCVAAHSADTVPALMTLDAVVELASPTSRRLVPINDMFVADGIWNSIRHPDELVTAIRIPLPHTTTRTGFAKMRQRGSIDFALLNMATAIQFDGRTITSARMVVSALGSRPRALSGIDKVAVGNPLNDDVIAAIADRAFQQCHPLENIIVDPEWRRAMIPLHARRLLSSLAS